MAERAKAKKSAAGTGSARGQRTEKGEARSSKKGTGPNSGVPSDPVEALRAECASLKAELTAAREEIARLEKRQELVVNRIDWVIDSLHNLLEDEA